MARAAHLELGPLEGSTLIAALDLSAADPHVLIPVRRLSERTARSESAVMWAITLLETRGLVEFSALHDGVYVTARARPWMPVLQVQRSAARN